MGNDAEAVPAKVLRALAGVSGRGDGFEPSGPGDVCLRLHGLHGSHSCVGGEGTGQDAGKVMRVAPCQTR